MTPGQSNTVHQGEECVTDATEERQLSLVGSAEDQSIPALREYPSRLFVETTTRCNLKCSMCVKQTSDNGIIEGDISPAVFSALEPALPGAESLVLNGIGEPLLHPQLEDFIRTAKRLMPEGSWV